MVMTNKLRQDLINTTFIITNTYKIYENIIIVFSEQGWEYNSFILLLRFINYWTRNSSDLNIFLRMILCAFHEEMIEPIFIIVFTVI